MGDELGVNGLPLDVPDGAGGVDAGGADALGFGFVPVEGCERTAELAVLVAVEQALELHSTMRFRVVGDAPNAEEVAGGGKEVGLLTFLVGDEDGFGGGIRVLEGEFGVRANLAVGVVELDNLDTVGVLLELAGYSEAILLVTTDAPVHGEDMPRSLVRVDLRSLLLFVRPILIEIAARSHLFQTPPPQPLFQVKQEQVQT